MDEKTEELRDLFLEVTDEDTVTERQEETPGSLADETEVRERVAGVVAGMVNRYDFETDLEEDDLCRVVTGFYGGDEDAEVAEELGVDEETVFRARMDLHLVADGDTDAPFDLDDLADLVAEGADDAAAAERLDAAPETVGRYRRVLAAREEARRANERYRDEFESVLADRDLAERMTAEVHEDGLEEATEGMETDVSF